MRLLNVLVWGLLLAGCLPAPQPPLQSDLRPATVAPTVPTASPPPVNTVPQPLAPAPEDACPPNVVNAAYAAMPGYAPSNTVPFISARDGQLWADAQPFTVYGVHYTPDDGLRSATLPDVLAAELDLIAGAGLNTVRVYVDHDMLFQCPGNDAAVPVPAAFGALDAVIAAAAERSLRVILVLNHNADATLYMQSYRTQQAAFLAGRYADEPALLAWDVRESGDRDYQRGSIDKAAVLNWLQSTAAAIRASAPQHLVTASWGADAAATAPLVDVVSFQAEALDDIDALRQQIAVLRTQTTRPLLLTRIGYSTLNGEEIAQRDGLSAALQAATNNNLAGWLVYEAFDQPATQACPALTCPDNRFGLWNTSAFPKLALDVVQAAAGD